MYKKITDEDVEREIFSAIKELKADAFQTVILEKIASKLSVLKVLYIFQFKRVIIGMRDLGKISIRENGFVEIQKEGV